ncbi:MAG: cyclic nucleotide-binding domain-containing protein [Pseudomonadota bacterium]
MRREDVANHGVFTGLTPGEADQVLALAREERFEKNEVVIEESGINSDLFLLLSGRVSVEIQMTRADGSRTREQIVRLRAPDTFGEIAFLEGKRRSAYVIASDDIQVLRINGEKLRALFESNNHIAYTIMCNLCLTLANRLIDSNFRWRNEIARVG